MVSMRKYIVWFLILIFWPWVTDKLYQTGSLLHFSIVPSHRYGEATLYIKGGNALPKIVKTIILTENSLYIHLPKNQIYTPTIQL